MTVALVENYDVHTRRKVKITRFVEDSYEILCHRLIELLRQVASRLKCL